MSQPLYAVVETLNGGPGRVLWDSLSYNEAVDWFKFLCGVDHRLWLDEIDYPDNLYSSVYYIKRMDLDDRKNK